ncbi:phage baseplate plug family protein [Collimonas pratensis]|uniref:phage baseplate plug family protein n=1 Tax=Collimonas pratensis TaxID=279113 RepID=UPI003B8A96A2
MLHIPIAATPSQMLSATLGGQQCQISIYQKSTGVYLDLSVVNAPVITAKICQDRVALVRHAYLGFIGDLAFCDTQGVTDPDYSGFGTRYVLIYLEASDL